MLHFFAHHEKNPAPRLCQQMRGKDTGRLFCFALRPTPDHSALEHIRVITINNPKEGEFYVNYQAATERKTGEHGSYHKSGAFHWKIPGMPYINPVDGEADLRRASLITQASDHFSGRLLGYCLAIQDAEPQDLKVMLKILEGLVIPEFDVDEVCERLIARKQFTLAIPNSEHLRRVVALCQSPSTTFTQAERVEFLRNKFGKDVDVFISDPKRDSYAIYSKEVTLEIIEICRDFVKSKMNDRSTDFYKEVVGDNDD